MGSLAMQAHVLAVTVALEQLTILSSRVSIQYYMRQQTHISSEMDQDYFYCTLLTGLLLLGGAELKY